jgi:antitoxin Phd
LRYAFVEVILMNIDTQVLVPMTEANQNFSKVVRLVDGRGMAVILKNNKPRYMVLSFQEYDEIQTLRRKLFNAAAESVISENLEALRELAK